jgi:hypothetical protein
VYAVNEQPRLFWSTCLIAGITVSNPDKGMDIGPLCFVVCYVADHSLRGVLPGVFNCVLSRILLN